MNERSRRGAAAVAGLFGLLAIVAVAAGGGGPGGGRSEPSASAPALLLDYLTTFALLVFAAAGAVLLVVLVLRRLYQPEAQNESFERRTARTLVRVAVVVALVVLIMSLGLRLIGRDDGQQPAAPVPTTPAAPTDGQAAGERYEPRFQWLPVLVVGVLVVGIAAVGTVAAVRRRRRALAEAPVTEALSEVLAESLDDLESERDPRRAVIRAYAQMERVFAARGLPRRESEAPAEYLTRLLDAAGVSAHSIQRLTSLFARARFSTHEVDRGMKSEAIEALGGLRAEIEAMG
jgi:NADH:ubiquinone oxidoreductase subunit 6 (subunit J)